MAEFLSSLVSRETHRQTEGTVREAYDGVNLTASIRRINHQAAAASEVDVDLVLDSESRAARVRWIREGEDGMAAIPNQPGEWRLILWEPRAMLNRSQRDASGAD